jgi:uncharacterized protein (TIGR02246 family)
MAVQRPEDMHRAFTEAFNAGDADALMALYEAEAALAPAPGQTVTGTAAIREALGGFLALNGRISIVTQAIVPAGDVVLLHGSWLLSGTGPDGSPVELAGLNTEVVRRQADGSWLFLIDNPFSAV